MAWVVGVVIGVLAIVVDRWLVCVALLMVCVCVCVCGSVCVVMGLDRLIGVSWVCVCGSVC